MQYHYFGETKARHVHGGLTSLEEKERSQMLNLWSGKALEEHLQQS